MAATTTANGADITTADQLPASAPVKAAVPANGFLGRHGRDYLRLGVADPANPDGWPTGLTVLYFTAFDPFITPAGAQAVREASSLDLVANGFEVLTGSPLGPGVTVFQKLPSGSDLLRTIVVIQRGNVIVKVAGSCGAA